MLKRDELTDPNSCLNTAKDDEPLFVLKADDPDGPEMVRLWAEKYISRKAKNGTPSEKNYAKYQEAFDLADLMDKWKLEKGKKE